MVFSLVDGEDETRADPTVFEEAASEFVSSVQIPIRSRSRVYSQLLVDQNHCYGDPLDFRKSDWQDRFAQIQRCYSEQYLGKLPPGRWDDQFFNSSNISQRYQFFENGVSWVYATHACYNYRSFMVEYFAGDGHKGDRIQKPPHFQYRWGFKNFGIPFPENDADFPLFEGNGSWIIVPGWLKHTSHLAQNAIFINHHLHYMNSLPPMQNVFFPNFNSRSEIKWTKALLAILANTHPEGKDGVTIHTLDEMRKLSYGRGRLCFRTVGMSGHVGHQGMGGYFLHPYEADTFRAAAYKTFDLHPETSFHPPTSLPIGAKTSSTSPRYGRQLKILYLPRAKLEDGRLVLNVKAMEAMIGSLSHQFLYSSVPIHTLDMRDQVRITMETDILLSVHGAAVATMLFLLPNSAYVELRPPNFRDNWYNLQANQAGLIYRPMNNFSVALPPECPSIDATLNPVAFQKCWKRVHFANFVVCIECLHDVLLQLYYDINLRKYGV